MLFLTILLWVSLLLGQLGALPLGGGVILYGQDIALSLLVLASVFRHGLFKKLRNFSLLRPITLFVCLGVVSLLVNIPNYPIPVIAKGSLYLLRWAVYGLFYGVIITSLRSSRFWLVWLGSFGVALSAIGLLQLVWYPDLRNLWYLGWDPHYYRVFATLLDPNYIGILLVLTIYVLLYLYIHSARWRLVIGLVLSIVGLALLLTYSRSSYLALLGGMGVSIVFLKRWKEGVFLVLLILFAVVYVPKPGGDTLSLDRYDSTVSRFQNWGQTITRIGERPLFGYGFNVVPFLGREEASGLPGRRGAGIDSSILFVGVTMGIAGLVSYLWLLYEKVQAALRWKNKDGKLLVLASFTAIAVHSLFVNSLFYPWVMIWMWTLTGVAEKSYLE